MTLVDEIRKNVTESTPLMAVVGVTDLTVERVKAAASNAAHLQEEVEKVVAQLEARSGEWQARVRAMDARSVQHAPVAAVHRVREVVGWVEESYGRLAVRGKDLVDRVRSTPPAQDLARQGKVTIGRTRAVMTSARRTLDDSASAALGVLMTGRREAAETATAVETEVAESVTDTEKVVEERTRGTRAAVREVAATMRRRAATTRSAARSATTSARNTVRKAVEVVEVVAAEIGEEPAARSAAAPAEPAAEPGPKAAAKAPAKAASRASSKASAKPAAAPDAPAE